MLGVEGRRGGGVIDLWAASPLRAQYRGATMVGGVPVLVEGSPEFFLQVPSKGSQD